MHAITRRELTTLVADGDGVVLVDHQARGAEKPSTLHAVRCRWASKTGARTPLRFAPSPREAIRWLTRERGDEGSRWQRCFECEATPEASLEGDQAPLRVTGEAVWTVDHGRNLGFVVDAGVERVEVASFDGPGRPEVGRRQVSVGDTSRFTPEAGDRCFVELTGVWHAGECLERPDRLSDTVSVLVNGSIVDSPVSAVRFRRLAPLLDPLADLADQRAGLIERFRPRARFIEVYSQMAAPTRGLLGVSSAAVDLYPHQVGVARRILEDPVQRYLLADEVGMGKTIEAGFVIRQRLIDAPGSVIVVLVPPALVWQWNLELESKFALSEIRRGGVEISSYDDERAFDRKIAPDLVVIDEAHRIAAGWGSSVTELSARYAAARDLAHRVPRLLLLSATPVLHREHDLLAMLHLLDPDTYRLDNVETFTARVRDRERIGELLLSLRPGAPAFLLGSRLPELRQAFAEDTRMGAILDRVERTVDCDGEERERALADARSHISETYRLHRRLLRNRRAAIQGTSFRVRGRDGCEVIVDGDPRRSVVDEWLERWRTTLIGDAHELGGKKELEKAARLFFVFVGAATGDLEVMRDLVSYRLERKRAFRHTAGLAAEDAETLRRGFPRSDAQLAVLGELLVILGDEEMERERRASRLVEALGCQDAQAQVVFATAPATIQELRERLEQMGAEVHSYTSDLSEVDRRPTAMAFMRGTGSRFLLCDATGEEGLNLQMADRVVHLDLPLSTTRLEQRIGRVDRHGDGPPVRSTILDPGPPGGFGAWWLQALQGSFRVFDSTTAPVQYAIETVERQLLLRLFAEGLPEAEADLARVEQQVIDEQGRIDRLDSLDALARQDTDDLEFVDVVSATEESVAGEFARSVVDSLKAQRPDLGVSIGKRLQGGFSLEFDRKPPALGVYSGITERGVEVTDDRRAAVATEEVSLLRPGAPLVEALRLQQEWDDRSQTAALWKRVSGLSDHQIAIRCDLVIRADPAPAVLAWKRLEAKRPRLASATRTDADAPLAVAALQRRLDAYLAPTAVSIWHDGHGNRVEDPGLLTQLEDAVETADDRFKWSEASWAEVTRRAGVISLADLMLPLRREGERAALRQARGQERAEVAAARAVRDWEDVERLLELRAEVSLDANSAKRDLGAEREVAKALIDALREPVAHWSGACLVVLSPDALVR